MPGRAVVAVVFCAAAVVVPLAAASDAGDLDLSFGSGGLVTTHVGIASSGMYDVALQADDKIVGFGQADYSAGTTGFAVTRHDVSGVLDPSFDVDGIALTAFGQLDDQALTGLVQPDGRIVAVGYSRRDGSPATYDFAVARYLASGQLDPSFDGDGKLVLPVGQSTSSGATAVALDAGGKIVLTGGAFNAGIPVVAVVRLESNGTPDPTFDGDGIVLTTVGGNSWGRDVEVQPDGKIVVAVDQINTLELAVLRYNANGSPDGSFGTGGMASREMWSPNPGWTTETTALALIPGGQILVGGDRDTTSGGELLVTAFTSAGQSDPSFLSFGRGVTTENGEFTGLSEIIRQDDGKIILAGSRGPNSRGPVTAELIRMTTDGLYDASFSCNGIDEYPLGPRGWDLTGAAIDSHGRLVAGSVVFDDTASDFGLARFHLTGTPNCSTGGGSGGGGGSGSGGGGVIPDLKLVGSVSPTQAPVGGAVTFVLSASTPDDAMAQNVVVTVNVPAGLTITGTTANRGAGCGPLAGGALTCNLDFLAGGLAKTGVITIGATIAQAGQHTLTATLKSTTGERNAADNAVTLTVSTPPVVAPTPATPSRPTAPNGKTLTGTNRANTLRGGGGPDVLNGRGGNDTLFGLGGNDRLLGGLGNDRLVGGLGRDTLLGGPGNDRLESRDGIRDQISCGAGKRDLAIVDRKDAVARDCETIRRR